MMAYHDHEEVVVPEGGAGVQNRVWLCRWLSYSRVSQSSLQRTHVCQSWMSGYTFWQYLGTCPNLRHAMGMFTHYSQWITRYSEKIRPLVKRRSFPRPTAAVEAFKSLKDNIANSVVMAIDSTVPFVVKTDASDHAIIATLNQSGRPVAFFTRTLSLVVNSDIRQSRRRRTPLKRHDVDGDITCWAITFNSLLTKDLLRLCLMVKTAGKLRTTK